MGHGGSKEAVVGVGDADGAGVRDKTSVFFGDEKEEAVIVLRRRGLPSAERRDDSKKEGGSKIGRGTPSSEGDPVGTRARIVGVLDGGEDGLEGGGRNEEGVNKLRVGSQEGIPLLIRGGGMARGPYLRPETRSDSGFPSIIKERGVRGRDTERRNASPRARKLIFENGDRVSFDGGRGGSGGEGEVLDSQLKAGVTPNAVAKDDQSLEIVIEREEPVNAGGVLGRRRNEAEEREVLGEGEGEGGGRKTKLASGGGGAEKRNFKLRKEFEGAFGVERGVPGIVERGNELGGGGEPKGDGGGGFLGGRVSGKGKRNGEVVREGVAKARGERTEIGWVVKDRNRRGGERGREERGRNKNTVETRGVGKFTSGVSSNVVISVFVVRNFSNRKTRLKKREGRQKRRGRKRGRKIGRVLRRFNEIEIASKEGRERTINRKKRVD